MQRISDLERDHVREKETLKKDMLRKIRETKMSLLAMTEDQLDETTKRTMMKNEQISTELKYQSRQSVRIAEENKILLDGNVRLKRDLELNLETQRELAKRTHFYQKMIKKLHFKLADKDEAAAAALEAAPGKEAMVFSLQADVARLQVTVEKVCCELDEVKRKLRTCFRRCKVAEGGRRLDGEAVRTFVRDVNFQLERIQDDAAVNAGKAPNDRELLLYIHTKLGVLDQQFSRPESHGRITPALRSSVSLPYLRNAGVSGYVRARGGKMGAGGRSRHPRALNVNTFASSRVGVRSVESWRSDSSKGAELSR